ncbi:MAG: hypothetical protein ACLQOO_33960 [Terriglobia bacterium]
MGRTQTNVVFFFQSSLLASLRTNQQSAILSDDLLTCYCSVTSTWITPVP